MAFKYKKINRANSGNFSSPRKPQFARDGEEALSGFVDGLPAKRDEEFFMSEIRKHPSHRGSEFRKTLGAPRHMPGWLELDALVETFGGYHAFEIDDMSFVHLGQRESAETKVKDGRRMAGLAEYGIIPVKGIEHLDAADLETRAQTKKLVRELNLTGGQPQSIPMPPPRIAPVIAKTFTPATAPTPDFDKDPEERGEGKKRKPKERDNRQRK